MSNGVWGTSEEFVNRLVGNPKPAKLTTEQVESVRQLVKAATGS